MTKIDKDQLNKLTEILIKKHILLRWILVICKVESLEELTVLQYNFLLNIIDN